MIEYLYSSGNLVDNPQKYQMTPFEGVNFLKKYRFSRQEIIQKLASQHIGSNFNEIYFNVDEKIIKWMKISNQVNRYVNN